MKILANRAAVRANTEARRVEIDLWSAGTEMTLSMSREEAMQKLCDLAQAIADLDKADAIIS